MPEVIRDLENFKRWAKIRMIELDTNQKQLAEQLGTVPPRISDAMRGAPNGKKYLRPIIRALGGDPQMFDLEALASKYKEKGA